MEEATAILRWVMKDINAQVQKKPLHIHLSAC